MFEVLELCPSVTLDSPCDIFDYQRSFVNVLAGQSSFSGLAVYFGVKCSLKARMHFGHFANRADGTILKSPTDCIDSWHDSVQEKAVL